MSKKAKIISITLIAAGVLGGLLMLFFGIAGTAALNERTKGYDTTQGYFEGYSLYASGGYDSITKTTTADTYTLSYHYTVQGQEYNVTTDYGTSFIPAEGSKKEIKYDPNHPEKAIIVGPNGNSTLLFVGSLFTVVSLVILLGLLGFLQTVSLNWIETAFGLVFIAGGYGALAMIAGGFSIRGIVAFFATSFSIPLLIPVLLVFTGLYLFIRSLFGKRILRK